MTDRLRLALQHLLPHHLLSRIVFTLTRAPSGPLTHWVIRAFARHYRIDLQEAADPDPAHYKTFNAFFTRALRPGARPLPESPDAIASPADGFVSAAGRLDGHTLLQAKGLPYDLDTLLGGAERASAFAGGSYLTVYLAPANYHRVHMPIAGTLREHVHIPGRLFTVASLTVNGLPRLFTRNERVATIFDSDAGPLAIVLVGALLVGSIETVWAGRMTPPRARQTTSRRFDADAPRLERGAELGRFNMGSTVILLSARNRVSWDRALAPGQALRMGEAVGRIRNIAQSSGTPRR